ncbi:hypothetical protein F5Y16DRAFT_373591 [Xylariaceae sp. FL0255]|nr:hypothetical protein F5Y16DRAFT_373591 [Xylariaceae sp. FL0255]
MEQWRPPPDPDKPDCPYIPGFDLQITEHEPPPPSGPGGYPASNRPGHAKKWLEETPQSQQVLEYPLEDSQWSSESAPRSAVFTITQTIVIGNARGAQLVSGHLQECGQEETHLVTAKIFDSLYYPSCDNLVNIPRDVVRLAERDYAREAAAYRHLDATESLQKPGFAPKYYGSWTFELPITVRGEKRTRCVRLILIEYLAGSSMLDLFAWNNSGPNAERDAFHYDIEYRLAVFAEILEGYMKQLHSGIDQHDLSPRNVMIVPNPQKTITPLGQTPRVVLIDYNISIVFEQTKYGRHYQQDFDRPLNPAQYFRSSPPDDFQGWIPFEWYDADRTTYQEWLSSRFGGDQAVHYEPVESDESESLEDDAASSEQDLDLSRLDPAQRDLLLQGFTFAND